MTPDVSHASMKPLYTLDDLDTAIQTVKRRRFFWCCRNGCKTEEPTCDDCKHAVMVLLLLNELKACVSRGVREDA